MGTQITSGRFFQRILAWSLLLAGTCSAADPTQVLILVNDLCPPEAGTGSTGASIYVGQYYASRRGIPGSNIVHLSIPLENNDPITWDSWHMSWQGFDTLIRTPIKNFLQNNGLTSQIKYIVPTYGIPLVINNLVNPFPSQFPQAGFSIDSFLAALYSGSDAPFVLNPYALSQPDYSKTHFSQWQNPLGWNMYLVTRLDGPSAAIAAGLVDKAILAESTLTKNDGIGYFDYQHSGNVPDFTMLSAYSLAVQQGFQAALNDQSITGALIHNAPQALWAWGWYSGPNDWDGYQFVNGAVGAQLTSYTANVIRYLGTGTWVPLWLTAGITATWGATNEPYTSGYANGDNLLNHFWNGYNFAESSYLAAPVLNWMMVFVGDPLYAPNVFQTAPGTPEATPRVSYTAQQNGYTYSGPVTMTAQAPQNVAVQFQADGADIGNELPQPPYTATFATSVDDNGPALITVKTRDLTGRTLISDPVPIVIYNTISVSPAGVALSASQTQQFTAGVTGIGNPSITWSISPAIGTLTSAGLYTAPSSIGSTQTVTLTATYGATQAAMATVTLAPALATIRPGSLVLPASQSQQFTATVTGPGNTAVAWSFNPAVGTLSANGLYTAPATVSALQRVTITASSVAYPSQFATAVVTLAPGGGAFTPIRVDAGGPSYLDSLDQTWYGDFGYSGGIPAVTQNIIGGTSTPTLYQSLRYGDGFIYSFAVPNGNYTVNLKFAELYWTTPGRVFNVYVNGSLALQNFDIFVAAGGANKAVDRAFPVSVSNGRISIQSSILNALEITQSVGVQVNPQAANLTASQSQQFTATVTGTTNTAVSWTLSPSVGTLSSSGLYAAPANISSGQSVTVKATSVADATKSASATVTLSPAAVTVSPTSAGLTASQSQQFTATVTGTGNTAVNWSINPMVGTILNGLYTAPSNIASAQTITVTAISQADNTKFGSATVNLTTAAMGMIAGTVRDNNSTLIANSQIRFSQAGVNLGGAITDASGHYSSIGLPSGTYAVTASAPGFLDSTVSGVAVGAGTVTTVNLQLTNSPPPNTYTIWPPTAVPALYESSPPMELGLKFRSDVNGWITGVRFYKNALNTGVHTGSLWTAAGTLLATGTFSGETASGWQQLNLASPAPISANTTYVATFHTNTGFSSDMDYFAANGTDNPPLHALQGHGWDPNGFFAVGSGGVFPNDANSSQRNYWVDVVFSTGATCSYTLSGTSQSFGSSGGATSVGVTAASGCGWTAVSNDSWITVTSGSPGNGNGTVNYSVAANAGASPRTGTMTIAGQTFTVSEAAACGYILSAASQSFGSSGGTNSVGVTAASGCGWTAVSNDSWITVTSGSSGNGNGTVNYSVAANAGSSLRTGTMTIAGQTFTVSEAAGSPQGTYTIWPPTAVPALYESSPPMELGLKFRSDVNGWITGIRFYKNALNTGVHTGSLWTITGTLLATGTFSGETASGWQQLNLASPVSISANTTYVATFHTNTGFSSDMDYFGLSGTDNPPLHAPQGHGWDPNGFFAVGSGGVFPNDANSSQRNYWVDVVFSTGATCSYTLSGASQSFGSSGGTNSVGVTAASGCGWTAVSNAGWITVTAGTSGTGSGTVNYSVAANAGSSLRIGTMTIAGQTFTVSEVAAACSYTLSAASQSFGSSGGTSSVSVTAASGCGWTATSNAGWITITAGTPGNGNGTVNYSVAANAGGSPRTGAMTIAGQTFTVSEAAGSPQGPYTIWPPTAVPALYESSPPMELGLKFRSDVNGWITGIRFYKNALNTGVHTGSLWTITGTLLATGTFSGETASGWQQLNLASPVSISANTTYVATFHTNTGFSSDMDYFGLSGTDNPPLHAPQGHGWDPNGFFAVGNGGIFPNDANSSQRNYWVDVVFSTGP